MFKSRTIRTVLCAALAIQLTAPTVVWGQDMRSLSGEKAQDPASAGGTTGQTIRARSPSIGFDRSEQIQVHVTGEVENPGTYMLPSPARLTSAITACGGFKRLGSQRRVTIKKEGQPDRVADLLLLRIQGDVRQNPYVHDNDIIHVPLQEMVVRITGPLKRPGEYELLTERSVADVLLLAGGFSVGWAQSKPISLLRYDKISGKEKVTEIAEGQTGSAEAMLENGDVISVPHLFTMKNPPNYAVSTLPNDNFGLVGYEDRVFVVGGVKVPGVFPYNPQYGLYEYYALAGGATIRGTNSVEVTSANGTRRKTYLNNSQIRINPGDTISVGEKRLSDEFLVGFLATLASIGLSAVAIFTR